MWSNGIEQPKEKQSKEIQCVNYQSKIGKSLLNHIYINEMTRQKEKFKDNNIKNTEQTASEDSRHKQRESKLKSAKRHEKPLKIG